MNTIIQTLLQINLFFVLFYLIYFFFLKKETHFKLSRYYLVLSLCLAVIIPFISLPEAAKETVQASTLASDSQYLFAVQLIPNTTNESNQGLATSLFVAYCIGLAFMLVRFIIGIGSIIRLIKTSPKMKQKGYWFVDTAKAQKPFSFLHFLFWESNHGLPESEQTQILNHELAHIRQWHTLDILLVELVHILFWYNPVFLFYKKALRNLHEYLADKAIISKNEDLSTYSELLLSQFFQSDKIYLTSQFLNKSILKSRIMMLHKTKSKRSTMLKVLWAIPVLALCLFVHACSDKVVEPMSVEKGNYTDIKKYNLTKDQLSTYNMVLSKDTYYRIKQIDGDKNVQFSITDSDGNVVMTNSEAKPSSNLYYQASKTGIYQLHVSSTNEQLDGILQLGFMRKQAEERTKDGLPAGFSTLQVFTIGKQAQQEFTFPDIPANTHVVFMLTTKDGNAEGIKFDVYNKAGKRIGTNKLGEKYYSEATVRCTTAESLTLKVSYADALKDATIIVGTRASKLPEK